jgi:thioredoxin 1
MTPLWRSMCASVALSVFGLCQAADRSLFPDPKQAGADLAAALQTAAASHRRVIVDFGGNWCTDCHVLDSFLHDETNRPLLEASFVLVHVNVGRLDKNLDLATRLQIPLQKGVPALAVLDADGTLLYSQRTGEFQDMSRMSSAGVAQWLRHWQPG